MRIRALRRLVTLALLIQFLLLSFTVSAQSQSVIFTIVNNSQDVICYVFISPSSDSTWGNDWLGENNVVPAETSITLQFELGIYDLLLLDCDQNTLFEQFGVEFNEDLTLSFYPSGAPVLTYQSLSSETITFTIVNKSRETICFVFISPVTSGTWDDDQLGDTEVIRPDSSRSWEVAPGWFDLLLQDCDENLLHVRREIDLRQSSSLEFTTTDDEVGKQWAMALNDQGLTAVDAGRYGEALEEFEEALAILQEIGDRSNVGSTVSNIGAVYEAWGHYELALEHYKRALVISRDVGDRGQEAATLQNIAELYDRLYQYARAANYYKDAYIIWHEVQNYSREELTLNLLGLALNQLGQSESALEYFQRALDISREVGDRTYEGSALNNIGLAYYGLRRLPIALEYYNRAMTISRDQGRRRGQGQTLSNMCLLSNLPHVTRLDYCAQSLATRRQIGDHSGEAQTLNNTGVAHGDHGRFEEAQNYFLQALTIYRHTGDKASQVQVLDNVGAIHGTQGQFEEGLKLYYEAYAIANNIGDPILERARLKRIGDLYTTLVYHGRHEEALDYYSQQLANARRVGDLELEASMLEDIGFVYDSVARYDDALVYYDQVLSIMLELGNTMGEGTTRNSIGLVYVMQGHFGEALIQYNKALAIQHDIGDRVHEAVTLGNLGQLYKLLGQPSVSLEYYEASLAMARESSVANRLCEGASLYGIGQLYLNLELYDDALEYFTQALLLAREIGYHQLEAAALNDIGTLHLAQNRPEDALEALNQALSLGSDFGAVYVSQEQVQLELNDYSQALAIFRDIGDRLGEATTLSNIGRVYVDLQNYGEALGFFDQALEIARDAEILHGEILALINRADAYEQLGQPTQALADYISSTVIIEQFFSASPVDTLITYLTSHYKFSAPYQRLPVLLAQQGEPARALEYAERASALLTRTQLIDIPINFRAGLDNDLLATEAELRTAINQAQVVLDNLHRYSDASPEAIQSAELTLSDAQLAYEQHGAHMQLEGGLLSRQIAIDTASVQEIQDALPEDTTLLVYSLSWRGSVVFMITSSMLDTVMLPITNEQVAEHVRAFTSDRRTNMRQLTDLYDLIFAPIADRITTSRLLIVPDGALHYVPFAALQSSSGRYVIDDFAVATIPSATTIVLLSDRDPLPVSSAPLSPVLVLAQPEAPGLQRLSFAQSEAIAIAGILGGEANIDATEAQLRSSVTGSRILYISAHAELNTFAPLFSAIHLGEGDGYDGRLEVREIYELDLSSTELVVLSGCETASSADGQDFGLLRRAFFAAGANQVVASLWSVDDEATAQLMTAYMRERANYSSEADALRAAMLETRANYPEPYYWASFTLTGIP